MTREDKWKYMTMSGAIVGGPTDVGLFQFPFSNALALWRMRSESKRAMKAMELEAAQPMELDRSQASESLDKSADQESYAQTSLGL